MNMIAPEPAPLSHKTTLHRWLLVIVLLVAVFFRFHALAEVPPGLTHDEASIGFFVRQTLNNTGFTIDAPYGYANEPFTRYSAALVMLLVGESDWALRVHQAFWGVLTVLFTYKWGRAAFSPNTGLGGAALVAVNFWPVMTSRFALNSNPAPALFTGAVWLMWVALFRTHVRHRWAAWLCFATLLAGALLTYEASRGAWLSLLVFIPYLACGPYSFRVQRTRLVRFALALAGGTALALPHLLQPAAWGRTTTLAGPLTAALNGELGPLVTNGLEALGTLFFKGDPFIVYNIPGRPVLDPLTGLLFVCGVLWCLWHWRKPVAMFSLLWLGAGFAPAIPIGAYTMMLHAIMAQAIVFLLPALAVEVLSRWLSSRLSVFSARRNAYQWAVLLGLTAFAAVMTARDYFGQWANATETRAIYFSNFYGVMNYLRHTDYSGSVALSSAFPTLPHDPFSADLHVRRPDLDFRWFDSREALVFPQTASSLLVLPVNALPDSIIAAHLPLNSAQRHIVRATDVDPYFDTVDWNPQQVLGDWLADGSLTRPTQPASLGGAIELIAYQVVDSEPSDSLTILTFWRILDPAQLGPRHLTNYAPEARLFVHLLDSSGNYVTGDDRLSAPAWNWHAGDTFLQIHRLFLPPDLAPGTYELRTGIYVLPDVVRLTGPDYDSLPLGSIALTSS